MALWQAACTPHQVSPHFNASASHSPEAGFGGHDSILIANPNPIFLGEIKAGTEGRTTTLVRNPTSESILIDKLGSSCSCIRLSPSRFAVKPGESAELSVVFDPAEDPEFRGTLLVEAVGLGKSGEESLKFKIRVTVK